MKHLPFQRRTLALLGVIIPLLALFIYVGLRSGPLAPVAVTIATVEMQAIKPALFGIGTVEARYTYKIGPTFAGRVQRLDVQVGESVQAGQVLGEMDPIDLNERVRSQGAAVKHSEAVVREAEARHSYAKTQAQRYEKLLAAHAISEEIVTTKQQELQIANATFAATREDLARVRYDYEALLAQRSNLRLIAPADGVVAVRSVDPGTTIVAGQSVVEVIDPKSLWINTRFDQINAAGLAADLPAHIVLRSRSGQALPGRVQRIEPMADAVTEETLAKVIFDTQPEPLPPLGELAEVTLSLAALATAPVISNATVRRMNNNTGVWQIIAGDLHFTPVKLGVGDLDGFVQVREGIAAGDQVVVYSEKALTPRSRIRIVDHIPGTTQ